MNKKIMFVAAAAAFVFIARYNVLAEIFIAPPGFNESINSHPSKGMYAFSDVVDGYHLEFLNGRRIDKLRLRTDLIAGLDSVDEKTRQYTENIVIAMSEYLGYPEEKKEKCVLNYVHKFLIIHDDVLADLFLNALEKKDVYLRLAGIEGLSRINLNKAEDKEKIIRGFAYAAGDEDKDVKEKARKVLFEAVKSCIYGNISYGTILNILNDQKEIDYSCVKSIVDENPKLFAILFMYAFLHGRGDIPDIAKIFFTVLDIKTKRSIGYMFLEEGCLSRCM